MIQYEKEVIAYLGLPSIPKKEHDGKSSFDKGVAVVEMYDGREAYAVSKFDKERDSEPRIVKVFAVEPFFKVKRILVVPDYMANEDDVKDMDLDDESKKKAMDIIKEANEIVDDGNGVEDEMGKMPEWVFPNITNRDEAEAFVRNYRQRNKIKGKIPQTEENLKTYLYVIYNNQQKLTKK